MFKPEEFSVEDALVAARGALRLVADLTCEECYLSKEAQQALCAMTSEAAGLIDRVYKELPPSIVGSSLDTWKDPPAATAALRQATEGFRTSAVTSVPRGGAE